MAELNAAQIQQAKQWAHEAFVRAVSDLELRKFAVNIATAKHDHPDTVMAYAEQIYRFLCDAEKSAA